MSNLQTLASEYINEDLLENPGCHYNKIECIVELTKIHDWLHRAYAFVYHIESMSREELYDFLQQDLAFDTLHLMAKGVLSDEPNIFATIHGLITYLSDGLDENSIAQLEKLSKFKKRFNDNPNMFVVLKHLYNDEANEEEVLDVLHDAIEYDWPMDRILSELDLGSITMIQTPVAS